MNTLHLYGDIADVFEGKTNPSTLTRRHAGVADSLSFGLGVSCFKDDLTNIGDAVYFNRRFFIRSTDDGERRDPRGRKFREGRARDYRTVYSLGVTGHPLDMYQKNLKHDGSCPPDFTIETLISRIVGPARNPGSPPRAYGFLGLIDYENIHSTSLAVPPIYGENIIPLMKRYARPNIPLPKRSGIVMGFVRDRTQLDDPENSRLLGRRLFFDNPKDNESSQESVPTTDLFQGPHWISHTHGIRLQAGHSVLPENDASLRRMTTDQTFSRSIVDRAMARNDYEDCGHVIPKSTLRRYFVVAFPIHTIESNDSRSPR